MASKKRSKAEPIENTRQANSRPEQANDTAVPAMVTDLDPEPLSGHRAVGADGRSPFLGRPHTVTTAAAAYFPSTTREPTRGATRRVDARSDSAAANKRRTDDLGDIYDLYEHSGGESEGEGEGEGKEDDGREVEGSNGQDEASGGDWVWQCHLCAYLNPLPRLYRDLGSVSPLISQPCTNPYLSAPKLSYRSPRPSPPRREPGFGRARIPRGELASLSPLEVRSGGAPVVFTGMSRSSGMISGSSLRPFTGSFATSASRPIKPCSHRRCEGCYDLNQHSQVVRFSSGAPVSPRLYRRWYDSFGFVDGVVPVVLDGSVRVHSPFCSHFHSNPHNHSRPHSLSLPASTPQSAQGDHDRPVRLHRRAQRSRRNREPQHDQSLPTGSPKESAPLLQTNRHASRFNPDVLEVKEYGMRQVMQDKSQLNPISIPTTPSTPRSIAPPSRGPWDGHEIHETHTRENERRTHRQRLHSEIVPVRRPRRSSVHYLADGRIALLRGRIESGVVGDEMAEELGEGREGVVYGSGYRLQRGERQSGRCTPRDTAIVLISTVVPPRAPSPPSSSVMGGPVRIIRGFALREESWSGSGDGSEDRFEYRGGGDFGDWNGGGMQGERRERRERREGGVGGVSVRMGRDRCGERGFPRVYMPPHRMKATTATKTKHSKGPFPRYNIRGDANGHKSRRHEEPEREEDEDSESEDNDDPESEDDDDHGGAMLGSGGEREGGFLYGAPHNHTDAGTSFSNCIPAHTPLFHPHFPPLTNPRPHPRPQPTHTHINHPAQDDEEPRSKFQQTSSEISDDSDNDGSTTAQDGNINDHSYRPSPPPSVQRRLATYNHRREPQEGGLSASESDSEGSDAGDEGDDDNEHEAHGKKDSAA